jgi:hypothetical protein
MQTPNERREATYQQKTELIVDWTKNQKFFNLKRINLLSYRTPMHFACSPCWFLSKSKTKTGSLRCILHARHVDSWVKAKLKLVVVVCALTEVALKKVASFWILDKPIFIQRTLVLFWCQVKVFILFWQMPIWFRGWLFWIRQMPIWFQGQFFWIQQTLVWFQGLGFHQLGTIAYIYIYPD